MLNDLDMDMFIRYMGVVGLLSRFQKCVGIHHSYQLSVNILRMFLYGVSMLKCSCMKLEGS